MEEDLRHNLHFHTLLKPLPKVTRIWEVYERIQAMACSIYVTVTLEALFIDIATDVYHVEWQAQDQCLQASAKRKCVATLWLYKKVDKNKGAIIHSSSEHIERL